MKKVIKQKQTKPKTTNKKAQKEVSVVSRAPKLKPSRAMVESVCGIVDPFCVHANGSKYPDFSSVRTLAYTKRSRTTITSDANGYANVMLNLQYQYVPFSSALTYTGNVVTAWNNTASYSSIAGVSGYRIVSAGFIVRHIVSPLNSAGMVYVRQYGSENGAFSSSLDTTTYNATSVANVPVQECKELAVVFQHNSQMPQNFYAWASDANNVINTTAHGYAYGSIAIAGAPASTAILELEFVTNYELIFEDSSDLAQVATPPPASNSILTSAASHLTSTLQPIAERGVASMGRMVVNKAITSLAGLLGGPAAAGLTSSALALTVD